MYLSHLVSSTAAAVRALAYDNEVAQWQGPDLGFRAVAAAGGFISLSPAGLI